MTDRDLLPGFCSVTTGARLSIAADDTVDPDFEPFIQRVVRTPIDPYVLVDGRVEGDSVHGGRVDFDGGSDSHTVYESAPLPEELDLGTWRRWLPYSEWLTAPGGGTRRWFPIETDPAELVPVGSGPSGTPQPRMALYTSADPAAGGAAADGRTDYDVAKSPLIDESYSYRGFDKEMYRNAMVFGGEGHASIEVERVFTDTTIGIVAVFHPSTNSHYGVFASNEVDPIVGTAGEPLVIRYTHGQLEVYQAHVRVLSYETHKSAHQAVIFLLALSSTNDEGRMLVIDNSRSSRQFNIDNLDFVSFGGMIGAEGQATTDQPVGYTADMDILELAIWDSALSFTELEQKANLLSLAYGVAG